jgi:hypothetical protein
MATYNIDDLSPIEEKDKNKKGQPGAGEPGEPEPGESEPGSEPSDEMEPGDDEETGDGEIKTPDQVHKEIQDKLGKKTDVNGKDPAPEMDPSKMPGKGGPNGVQNSGKTELRKIEKLPRAKFSWRELVRQFVATAKHTETTYAKMHRRTITAMTGVAATGAGAIKPGERPMDEAFKLAIIFDSTGSMHRQMPVSLAETEKLIRDYYGDIAGIMGIGLFGANKPSYFALNLETKKFWNVVSFADLMKKAPANAMPMADLFKLGGSGANELPKEGSDAIKSLLSQGYNVIMITDTGIAGGSNWKNLLDILRSHKSGFFLILDSEQSFQYVVRQLGSAPNNIGHF